MRVLLAAALGVVSLVLVGGQAMAQNSTSGAIQGVVTDKATGESLSGVTVVVTSAALQQPQAAITEGGTFKISNLPPGMYVVTFHYSDITVRRTNVQVTINKTTPAYQKIDTAQAGGEVITITQKAPTIDPTSTTQGVTLDQDYTQNIPVPGRTFESALGAAPGSAGDGLGVSFSGSTSLENSYVVDGVNTTGLTYGTVGSPLINDFIEEIEIITGGYNAEYGRATGGVVNVVTKSGSNEFHGTVFGYVRPGALVATRERTPIQFASIDAESNLAFDADFGFDLGGPIVKDKVWFYVGFAPRLVRTDITRITKRRTDCRSVLADGSLSRPITESCTMEDAQMYGDGSWDEDPETGFLVYEDLTREGLNSSTTSYQFVAKVNFAVSPEHQGQISIIGTPATGESIGVTGAPSATRFDITNLTTDVSGKWTSKFNNNKTEVEAVLGWHRASFFGDSIDDSFNNTARENLFFGNLGTWGMLGFESQDTIVGCTDSAAAGDPYPFIENCPDEGLGYRIGGPGGILDDQESRVSARVSGTQRVKAAGNHEIKVGADVENNRLNRRRVLSGGAFFDNYLAPYNQVFVLRWVQLKPPDSTDPRFDDQCRDSTSMQSWECDHLADGSDVQGETFNWSAYARDSWQVMPNLTLNYGLRYEEQRLRFAEELQGTTDPFTERELGTNAMLMRNMWAPRAGILYDWTKEGRSKIYGHWGRFYESIPMDINDRSFGGETLYQQSFDSTSQCGPQVPGVGGPSGEGCIADPNQVASLGETLFGSGVLVAPGIKGQYMDEYIFGVEYEILEDLKLGLSYQNRSLGRVLEDVSTDNADTYILANPGEWSADEEDALLDDIAAADAAGDMETGDRLRNELEQFRGIRIFDKPRRDYNAIQLTATKRFSRSFFLQASYTYSRTQGNFPGLFSADNGQVDPNITSQYDLIELLANRDGPLPQDRPHYFKIDGYYIYDLPGTAGSVTTGTRIRALSGTPIDALGRHYLYGFGESFVLPRGAMGRTEFDWGIDIHLAYSRKLGKGMELEVFTDLYNIFNDQGTFSVDEDYTFDPMNPIVGGEYEDLVWAKAQTTSGGEQSVPVARNRNFLNVAGRYSPFSARFGARLTF
jgi:hypothetical protein